MTTFSMDYVNGNNAADGSTFALGGLPTVGPWKDLTSGATAARIAPNDLIRHVKSPDPTSLGQTAAWTNLSKVVTLQTAALTANICTCDHVAEAWTPQTHGTPSSDTTNFKMGTANSKAGNRSVAISVLAGVGTNELLAYRDLGATGLNLSGYQQISFYIRNTVATLATHYVIKLCSDQAGATPVNTFTLPALPATAEWVAITIDLGGALGNPIKSVALYSGSAAPSVGVINLDNILACKTSASADSLTLQSLISKTSAAQGGTEGWYCIQSINGVTILIDNAPNTLGNAGRGYTGVTEIVAIYKRETIKTAMVASLSVQTIQDSGLPGSLIRFEGGYNPATGIQDGETIFDGLNGQGYGINYTDYNYFSLNHLSCVRYAYGMQPTAAAGVGVKISNSWLVGNTSAGHYHIYNEIELANILSINNGVSTIGNGFSCSGETIASGPLYAYGNLGAGIGTTNGVLKGQDLYAKNNRVYGVQGGAVAAKSITTADNGTSGLAVAPGPSWVKTKAASVSETTPVTFVNNGIRSFVALGKFGGVTTDHRVYTNLGNIFSETSVRHTASGYAWKIMPTNALAGLNAPLIFPLPQMPLLQIAVNANAQVTVKAWLRRSNTGLSLALACRGGQIAGVDADLRTDFDDSGVGGVNNWAETTLLINPTESGIIEIEVWAWGGTTYAGYIDDLTITQAGGPVRADLLTLDLVKNGHIWCMVPAGPAAAGGLLVNPGMSGGLR